MVGCQVRRWSVIPLGWGLFTDKHNHSLFVGAAQDGARSASVIAQHHDKNVLPAPVSPDVVAIVTLQRVSHPCRGASV